MKFLIFFLLLPVAAFSQDKFRAGVKAGLNYSDLNGGQYDDYRVGFHAGGFAYFVPSPAFQIGGELIYSNQGAKYTFPQGDQVDIVYNYLYDAIIAKAFVIPNRLNIQFGAQGGIPLGAKFGESTANFSDLEIDYGILLGMAYQANKLDFSLRYNLSLSEVEHRVFQFSVGYAIF